MNAQGPRGGDLAPALVLMEDEAGRRAVALAEGFWRWGVRDGEGRRAYRALWGGVTSWLLARPPIGSGAAVRPETIVQSRGEPLRWEVQDTTADLQLTLTPLEESGLGGLTESTAPRFQGPLRTAGGPPVTTPPVEPGVYRFDVRDVESSAPDSILSTGLVEVERWAPSLRLLPLDLEDQAVTAMAGSTLPRSGGRPLRTHPLPYLILLLLLSAEWIGRRRVGLR